MSRDSIKIQEESKGQHTNFWLIDKIMFDLLVAYN